MSDEQREPSLLERRLLVRILEIQDLAPRRDMKFVYAPPPDQREITKSALDMGWLIEEQGVHGPVYMLSDAGRVIAKQGLVSL